MKKLLLMICLFLGLTLSFGQEQSIKELSTGILERSKILSDANDQVIGYVYLFNNGLINEEKNQAYEFVLLDASLNKVTNGTFQLPYHKKIKPIISSVYFKDQHLIVKQRLYQVANLASIGDLITQIDLKNNTIVKQNLVCYGTVYDDINFDYFSKIDLSHGGFFINDLYVHLKAKEPVYYELQTRLRQGSLDQNDQPYSYVMFYDDNFNKTYEYYLSHDLLKKDYSFTVEHINENDVIIWQRKRKFDRGLKLEIERLLTYDYKTGQLKHDIVYNSKATNGQEYYVPYVETIADKTYVIGDIKLIDDHYVERYQVKPSLGIKRNVYDDKGEVVAENKIYYQDIFKALNFKNGKDKDGNKYIFRDYFNFPDQSFTVLLAKQKGDGVFTAHKLADYIVLNFDASGNYINHIVLENRKSKYDTYKFAQKNPDENEILFFYEEEIKEQGKTKYYLVINKLKENKVTQEKIPFETNSSLISFSKAKYGFILVSEFDKENKESVVRLEKINL